MEYVEGETLRDRIRKKDLITEEAMAISIQIASGLGEAHSNGIVHRDIKSTNVASTQYNTTSLLRTIEQILGLPQMNQFDATATPMFDCFTATPDFTPFASVPNRIPLDQMNPDPDEIADDLLRRNALISARLNFRQIDACPEDMLNRILWHSVKRSAAPYPSWAVTLVADDDDD
jgi:hypothetical protein